MRSDDPSSCDDSKKDEEPKTPADDHRHGDPPLRDGIPHSGGGASKEDEKPEKPKTPANDSEKDEKPEKPKTPANDSKENEKPKTPARDDSNGDSPLRVERQQSRRRAAVERRTRPDDPSSCDDSKNHEEPKTPADDHRHGDPPLRRAKLPMKGLMVLLAVIAIMLALLSVDTLKSQPGTKATTVTVLYAFAFSVVIWLKLEQPRITKGYTLISICQFLMIRLVFTAGFVCIACIVSVFIPDGLGWIVIYVSVNGTVSCILVAWDIASMFRAAVSAETHNA